MATKTSNKWKRLCKIVIITAVVVLVVDAAQIAPLERAQERLIRRRILERIPLQQRHKRLHLAPQLRRLQLWQRLKRTLCVDNLVHHHTTSSAGTQSSSGVFIPSTISSSMPGIDIRYSVSIMLL